MRVARRAGFPAVLGAVFLLLAAVLCPAREVALAILHTTDLHGQLLGDREGGGLLRCASLVEGIRERERNVIVVDGGDLVQGSAESWLARGRIMVRALDWLRYDAWVVGNHEFDWGLRNLVDLQAASRTPVLGANIVSIPGTTSPLGRVRPFVIKEVDGVRVALVGLTTPAVPMWTLPEDLDTLRFEPSVDALAALLPRVREARPDVMVLLVHQGYQEAADDEANQVGAIARRFPEFDVVLGGHLHTVVCGARLNGVLYSQAGSHGRWLGRVDLVYDTVRRKVVASEADMLPVDQTVPVCEGLRLELAADLEKAERYLQENVGSASAPIDGRAPRTECSATQDLVCRAIARAARAEIVLHGTLNGESLEAGPIRRRDIWRIVPYENRLCVLRLTAQELREILEANAAYAGGDHFLTAHGLEYRLDASAPEGQRVADLRLADGTKPHPRLRLKVVTTNYLLASGGGRFRALSDVARRPTSRLQTTDIDTRTAVTDYVRRFSPISPPTAQAARVVRIGALR